MKKMLKGVLIFSVLMLALFGGYLYISYEKSKQPDTELLEMSTSQYQKPLELKDGRVDDVSINVVYYVNREEDVIKEAVLEILNCRKKTLSYLVIPGNTQISITPRIYQKMTAVNAKMPQYFAMDHIKKSIDHKKWAGYGQLILDSQLDMDSSYYSVVYGSENTFEEHINNVMNTLSGRDSIENYIHKAYEEIKSNLSEDEKLEYLDYYADLPKEQIQFYELPGTSHTAYYEMDTAQAKIRITELSQGIQ